MSQKLEHAKLPVQVDQIVREFEVNTDQICSVTRHFVQMMSTLLSTKLWHAPKLTTIADDGLANRCMYQLPSYVRSVPVGTETGRFLAVDLGGSNCRICLVDLHGDSTFTVAQSKHTVLADVRINQSHRPVFAFIAERIEDFVKAHLDLGHSGFDGQGRERQHYQLGFTFSFTYEQTSIAKGTVTRWDKGWDIPGAVGKDPCAMLQEAIDNLTLPVHVSVLANDSVGTLLTRSYTSGQGGSTLGAVIFGTGTNAAYIEKLANIRRIDEIAENGDVMVINTEWGSFDEQLKVLPSTQYDEELDANSPDPGSQMFEKCVSGMYLGELLRLVILRLLEEEALHMRAIHDSPLFRQNSIDSSFLSHLAGDDNRNSERARVIIAETLAAENVTLTDAQSIQLLAAAIAQRAARLAGASLAAVIIQSGRLGTPRPSAKFKDMNVEEYQPQLETHKQSIGRFDWLYVQFRLLLRRVLGLFGIEALITVPTSPPSVSNAGGEVPEDDVIDIGADGSLIEFYPTFEAEMRAAMREVPEVGPIGEQRIRIGLAKDGSGVGAALMTQAALHKQGRN